MGRASVYTLLLSQYIYFFLLFSLQHHTLSLIDHGHVSVTNLLGEYCWMDMHMHVLCVAGGVHVWMFLLGEALDVAVCTMARRCLYMKLVDICMLLLFLLLVLGWCMDVCRNVDSFPFRQIFAPPIRPTFKRSHAEFFRRTCMCDSFLVSSLCIPRRQPWSST